MNMEDSKLRAELCGRKNREKSEREIGESLFSPAPSGDVSEASSARRAEPASAAGEKGRSKEAGRLIIALM